MKDENRLAAELLIKAGGDHASAAARADRFAKHADATALASDTGCSDGAAYADEMWEVAAVWRRVTRRILSG